MTLSNDLRYVVTVCAADFKDKDQDIGLIFVDRNNVGVPPTVETITNILMHDDLEAIFGSHYWGAALSWVMQSGRGWLQEDTPQHHGVFVSTNNLLFEKAGLVSRREYYLRYGELLTKFSGQDAHDKCILLMKLMGCEKCSIKPYECLQQNVPKAIPIVAIKERQVDPRQLCIPNVSFERVLPGYAAGRIFGERYWEQLDERLMNYDGWRALKFVNWKSVIANYQLISPLSTHPDVPAPTVRSVRRLCHHDFTDIETNRDALSERSRAGAETRKRIRTECSKCYFGWTTNYNKKVVHPCCKWRVRGCEHNAWTEERLVDYTLERFERTLEGTPWDLESMWKVACVCGVFFKKKSEHTGRQRQWVLQRIYQRYGSQTENSIAIVASRTSRDARGPEQYATSPQAVRNFLSKELQAQWDDTPPMNRERFALWLHLAITSTGRSYSYVFNGKDGCGFGSTSPAVGWVSLDTRGYGYGGATRCLWLSREERTRTFTSFKEIFDHYEDLLLFGIAKKEDEVSPSLHPYVR
jgi:hypothetical protein